MKLILLTLAVLPLTASAVTRTWDGGGANNNWGTAANWDLDTLPVAGNDLVFPSGLAAGDKSMSNTLTAGTAFNSLTFGDHGYTLAGNALTVSAGITVQAAANGVDTISAPLTLGGAQIFQTGDTDAELTVSGTLNLNSRTLTVHGSGTVRLNGTVSGTTAASAIQKDGTNELILGNGTFAGPVTLNAGTLTATRSNSLGTLTAATTVNGGTLRISNVTGQVLAENITVSAGTLASELGSHTITGVLTLNGAGQRTVNVGTGAELILSNAVAGTAGLLHTGAGVLYFADNGNNTVAGGVQTLGALHLSKNAGTDAIPDAGLTAGDGVTAGTVLWRASDQVNDGATITALAGSTLDFNGEGDTIKSLTLTGGAVLGAAPLTIERNLTAGGAAVTSTIAGKVTLRDSLTSTWTVNDGAAAVDLLVSATVTGGAGTSVERDGAGFMGLSNSFTVDALTLFDGQTEVTGTVNAPVFLNGGSLSGTGTVGALASQGSGGSVAPGAPSSAAGKLSVSGALTLGSSLTFSAGLTSSATPGVTHDQLKVTGAVSVGGATFALTERAGFTALHGDRFVIIDNDGVDVVTGAFAGLPEGTLISVGSHRFRISYSGGDGNDVELSFVVAATGVTRTWDAGGGANLNWTLPANWAGDIAPVQGDALVFPLGGPSINNFPAGTTFDSLTFTDDHSISGNGLRLIAGITSSGNAGGIVGLPLTLNASQVFHLSGTDNFVCAALATIDTAGFELTFQNDSTVAATLIAQGVISGSGSLRKTGSKSLTLNGANTFTGQFNIDQGTVSAAAGAVGSPAGGTVIAAGAALVCPATSEPFTIAGMLSTSTGLSPTVFSGDIVLPAGATGSIINTNPALLTLTGALSGSGSLSLRAISTGGLLVGGATANTFTGTTTIVSTTSVTLDKSSPVRAVSPVISTGTSASLTVNSAGAVPAGATLTTGNGSAALFNVDQTLGALTFTGTTLTAGAGHLITLSGNVTATSSTFAGSMAVAGAGRIWNNTFISSGSANTVNAALAAGTADAGLVTTGGHWRFNGSCTLPGGLTASTGSTARVNGNAAATAVTLTGGTLAGNGVTSTVTHVSGSTFVTPTGTLSTASFTAGSGCAFIALVSHGGGVPFSDRLAVGGSVTLSGASLSVNVDPGSLPRRGDVFTIINNDGTDAVSGIFTGKPEGSTLGVSGINFRVSYVGGDGNDVTLTVPVTGVTKTWDGGGADNLWSNALNWSTDVAPVAGDALVFPAGAPQPVNVNDIPGVTFASLSITQDLFSVSGNPLSLLSGLTVDVGNNAYFNVPLTPAAAQTWSFLNGTSVVQPTSGINLTAPLTVNTTAAASLFTNGVISGAAALTKTGGGQLLLTADNTFTGQLNVQQGSVRAAHDHALGSPAVATFVTAPGSLLLENATTIAEPIILNGATLFSSPASQLECTGPIGLTGACTFNAATGSLMLSGPVNGTGSATFSGFAQMSGNTPATWTGGTTVTTNATLRLNKSPGVNALPGSFTVQSNGHVEVFAAHQIPDTATATLLTGAGLSINPGAPETIGGLELTGAQVSTDAELTIAGNVLAHATNSNLFGNIRVENTAAPNDGRLWTVEANGFISTYGPLSGNPLHKHGPGNLHCYGDGSTIAVRLHDGVLLWNGDCPNSAIVTEHGTLRGTGRVGSVSASGASGARLEPGQAVGIFRTSNFVGESGLALSLQLNGTTRGTQYDGLDVLSGLVALQNTVLELIVSYPAAIGGTFTIINNAGSNAVAGFFSRSGGGGTLFENSTMQIGGHTFRITYHGGDGNDVVLTKVEPVPVTFTSFSITPGTGPNAGQNVVAIAGQGNPGQNYDIEVSPDLVKWTLQIITTADSAGAFTVSFTESPNLTRRLYRFVP